MTIIGEWSLWGLCDDSKLLGLDVQPRIYNFHGLDGVYMYSLEYITFMVLMACTCTA